MIYLCVCVCQILFSKFCQVFLCILSDFFRSIFDQMLLAIYFAHFLGVF